MKVMIVVLICISFFIFSCNERKEEAKTNSFEQHGDTIFVAKRSGLYAQIKEQKLKEQSYHPELITGGIVRAIPNQYAVIAAPFAGRIVKSYVKLGMKVKAGAPLFELNSPDFLMAQKAYFQSKTEFLLADKKLKRQQSLLANGVGTQRELEEAQAVYEVEQKELENASQGIRLFKAVPDQLIFGQPLIVCSPIAGDVVEDRIVVGQYVKNDEGGVARVAELSKVWVAGQIKEKDMELVHSNDQCIVSMTFSQGRQIQGIIKHISNFVNEETRSMEVLIECDNNKQLLKPGMYVNVGFTNCSVGAILIPAQSVLQQSNNSYVLKKISTGEYVKQNVQVKPVENGKSMVQFGLIQNDVIITEGAYFLAGIK